MHDEIAWMPATEIAARIREKQLSPIDQIRPVMPPTYIIHGDKDMLVPLQQSQTYQAKMLANGSKCELVVVPGVGHGWANMMPEFNMILDFFKRVLL